jgi:transposase
MARRSFVVVDVTESLIHWHAGRSISQVAASLGVDRKTIRKYLAPALAVGIQPGEPSRSTQQWAELVAGWFPHLVDTRLRQVTWPQIGAHHQTIKAMLAAGVTQATIHQRLRDEHGLEASVASLRRYVAAMLPKDLRRGQVVVLREEVPPGEEAQIDNGYLGSWVDPVGGRRRRVWAFVMVLACSRHLFVRPVLTMDQRAWTAAHGYLPGCCHRRASSLLPVQWTSSGSLRESGGTSGPGRPGRPWGCSDGSRDLSRVELAMLGRLLDWLRDRRVPLTFAAVRLASL